MPSNIAPARGPLILALDTSSSLGSVALACGGELLKARSFEADHGHSQRLLPAIEALFSEAGVDGRAIDRFAAVVGPGSFTGLRVGLACLRGLAGSRPCFGALATDVAAWAARGRGSRILAITDLFHGEVFGCVHDEQGEPISDRESGELGDVLATLKSSLNGPALAVGSATLKHRAQIESALEGVTFVSLNEGLAPHLAGLCAVRASDANTSPAGELLPFYLRDPLTRGLLGTPPRAR